jgi:hypothetical protein
MILFEEARKMLGALIIINIISAVVMLFGLAIAFGNQEWASKAHMWLTIGATAVAVISSTFANILA